MQSGVRSLDHRPLNRRWVGVVVRQRLSASPAVRPDSGAQVALLGAPRRPARLPGPVAGLEPRGSDAISAIDLCDDGYQNARAASLAQEAGASRKDAVMGLFGRPRVPVLPEAEEPDIEAIEEKRSASAARFLTTARTLGPAQLSAQAPGLRFGPGPRGTGGTTRSATPVSPPAAAGASAGTAVGGPAALRIAFRRRRGGKTRTNTPFLDPFRQFSQG